MFLVAARSRPSTADSPRRAKCPRFVGSNVRSVSRLATRIRSASARVLGLARPIFGSQVAYRIGIPELVGFL